MTVAPPPAGGLRAHPLIERLRDVVGCVEVDAANVDVFTGGAQDSVLFVSGDPKLFPESLDVAVILPELVRSFDGRFRVGIVARQDEKALQARYSLVRLPALVFLRGGRYVGVIAGVRDWGGYLARIDALLAAEPGEPPAMAMPGPGACAAN